jgi:Ca-activated chloride channel homolog
MSRHSPRLTGLSFILVAAALLVAAPLAAMAAPAATPTAPAMSKEEALAQDVTQGALRVVKPGGEVVECPLQHTDVKADVSGFIARVKVTQTFFNPLDEKIEAVYVFPLPHQAAVDDMTMVLGERKIVGLIKRRAEARSIYEQALAQGMTAALLEQERPNIFTQSVGNIAPKQEVKIEISYVDVLAYDMGTYEFHFPMVVGPRYIPGGATSAIAPVPPELKGAVGELDKRKVVEGSDAPKGTGWSPDTTRVPDASRITPPVLKPGMRNGHDISFTLSMDAGVPIQDLVVANHKANVNKDGKTRATIALDPSDSIPNKDFVVRYGVVGKKPEMALLTHTDSKNQGYFMLMVQPAEDEKLKASPPREIVFMIDVSGSMSGLPTAKNIQVMQEMLRLCKGEDTVQVITFANQADKLFEKPVPVNEENIKRALNFTQGLRGGGGTEMLKGVKMAINEPADEKRVRIIVMLTDGFIGNEAEIIAEVGKTAGDRLKFWVLGIGNSVNRFLVDGVAKQGGGMGKVLELGGDSKGVAVEVMQRIHQAQLSNISIDWAGLKISETYPAKLPELWADRPLIVYGLFQPGAEKDGKEATIRVTGKVEGEAASWPVAVFMPAKQPANEVLSKVWARQKIEDLMQSTYYAGSPAVEEVVTGIALEYRLMSQYTSFVAVDANDAAKLREPARPPRRMLVPVPIPEGTRYEGFFGPVGGERAEDSELTFAKDKAAIGYVVTGGTLAYNGSVAAKPMAPMPSMAPPASRKAPMGMAGGGRGGAGGGGGFGGKGKYKPGASSIVRSFTESPFSDVSGNGLTLSGGATLDVIGIGGRGDKDEAAERGQFAQAISAQYEKIAKQAQEALKAAQELQKKESWSQARALFIQAYMLDNTCGGAAGVDDEAMAGIEKTGAEILKIAKKEQPALDKTLDLVIRDKKIDEALLAVGKAAGLTITVFPGSLDDAATVLGVDDVRVTYLDLRGATAAQALDWILVPARMTWLLEKANVTVNTARRQLAGESPWVYDVSLMALPTAKEMEPAKGDYQKQMEIMNKAAETFINGVRKSLGAKEDQVVWYGSGQLLVIGDAALHAKAAKVLSDLADPKAALAGDAAALQKVTAARAEGRKEDAAKMKAAGERVRTAQAMTTYGWQLLAAAANGKLDLEALTELDVAWSQPAAGEIVKSKAALIALRSAWAIHEAKRMLPKEKELADLARKTSERCKPAVDAAMAAMEKGPQSTPEYWQLLYVTLANRDDAAFVAKAKPLLTPRADPNPVGRWPMFVASLLEPINAAHEKGLADILAELQAENGTPQPTLAALAAGGGDWNDLAALLAMASHRAGGKTWENFRAAQRELLGKHPVAGVVVVYVNALNRPAVTAAAAKP